MLDSPTRPTYLTVLSLRSNHALPMGFIARQKRDVSPNCPYAALPSGKGSMRYAGTVKLG
jgi:hypothetical protein